MGKDPALKERAQVAAPTRFQLPEQVFGALCPKISVSGSSVTTTDRAVSWLGEVISRSKENLPGGPGVFARRADAQ